MFERKTKSLPNTLSVYFNSQFNAYKRLKNDKKMSHEGGGGQKKDSGWERVRENWSTWVSKKNLNSLVWKTQLFIKAFLFAYQNVTQMSILPTFYELLFHTKFKRAAFLFLQIRFKRFWCKEIGKIVAHKMLVKSTTAF